MGAGAIAPPSDSKTLQGVTERFATPDDLPDDHAIELLVAVDQLG